MVQSDPRRSPAFHSHGSTHDRPGFSSGPVLNPAPLAPLAPLGAPTPPLPCPCPCPALPCPTPCPACWLRNKEKLGMSLNERAIRNQAPTANRQKTTHSKVHYRKILPLMRHSTANPKPQTLNPKPQTLNPQALNPPAMRTKSQRARPSQRSLPWPWRARSGVWR